ncbi:hypothetical protein [Peribacillus muralis]
MHANSKKVEGERKSIEPNVHHKYENEHFPQRVLEMENLKTL